MSPEVTGAGAPDPEWADALGALESEHASKDLGERLLANVRNRLLPIEVLGEKMEVRWPTKMELKNIGKALVSLADVKEQNDEGTTEAAQLEAAFENIQGVVAEKAAWICEPTVPSMDEAYFRTDAGLEVGVTILQATIEAASTADVAVATFRPKQQR